MNWLYNYITNIVHPQPKNDIENAFAELKARTPELCFERSWQNILRAWDLSDVPQFQQTQALYVEPK